VFQLSRLPGCQNEVRILLGFRNVSILVLTFRKPYTQERNNSRHDGNRFLHTGESNAACYTVDRESLLQVTGGVEKLLRYQLTDGIITTLSADL